METFQGKLVHEDMKSQEILMQEYKFLALVAQDYF
jgi:hypothetical protein